MGRLFGTDGIRGRANSDPITAETALNIGRALALLFKKQGHKVKIIIGKDTRISGYMLEYALISGICSMGGDAYPAGVLPTPGIAFITASSGADAGIVISASHNPFYDNGIKIFKSDGYKLSDEAEAEIEALLKSDLSQACRPVQETGAVYPIEDAEQQYAEFLKKSLQSVDKNDLQNSFTSLQPADKNDLQNYFRGMKIILDCSNGATCRIAPRIFTELGADVESLFISPDGKNINENCGSQHTETLAETVVKKKATVGLAFDGDGDRLIAVDEKGKRVTGDQILAICADFMKQKGILRNNLVVSTVMSNLGFKLALKKMGIRHIESDVGDRYVLLEMRASGAVIGGEDSGHTIFLNHHTTGDGILTALKLTEIIKTENKPLSELSRVMTVFPQILINVEVDSKPDIETIPEIQAEIRAVENRLGERGRVLVRYSGTQPLCRVMIEGPTPEETRECCDQIVRAVRNTLGKRP